MKTLLDTIKELHDVFYFHTFENGVQWINEHEAAAFKAKHPELVDAIGAVISEASKFDEWNNE
jgi:hypothetical protein